MKYVLWAVLGLLVVCGVVGCATLGMTKEDTAMLKELRNSWLNMVVERRESLEELYADRKAVYEKIEAQKKDIMAKLDAGEIPFAEAEKLVAFIEREGQFTIDKVNAEIERTKDDFDEQMKITNERMKELEKKGYKWWQIVGSILCSFGTGVLVDRKKLTGIVTG